jgi:hypothetical protein
LQRTNTNFTSPPNPNAGCLGWEFIDNTIVISGRTPTIPSSGTIKYYAISAYSGTIITGNKIYFQREDASHAGIYTSSYEPWPTLTSSILGAIIKDNYIYSKGSGLDISVNQLNNSSFYNLNVVCTENFFCRSIVGNNASRNYFANNTNLLTQLSSSWLSPDIPVFQTFEWNKNNY